MTVILTSTLDYKVEGHTLMMVSQGSARTLAWSRAPMPPEGCVLLGFYMQKKHSLVQDTVFSVSATHNRM